MVPNLSVINTQLITFPSDLAPYMTNDQTSVSNDKDTFSLFESLGNELQSTKLLHRIEM
jgi:hypothetical protein